MSDDSSQLNLRLSVSGANSEDEMEEVHLL